MAKAAGAPAGMQTGELRSVIKAAQAGPVHVAFAVGADGRAIVQADRRTPPRALEKALKEAAPDSRTHRFGTMLLDPSRPMLARFVVNKAAAGMARKLAQALKGTGIREVEVALEDGTALESAAGEDEEGGGPLDAGTLTRTLSGLVRRMIGVLARDPAQRAALAGLATDAQAALKGGDLAAAAASIHALGRALDAAPALLPAAGIPGRPAAQTYVKARAAWLATRLKVDAEIRKLSAEVARRHGPAGMEGSLAAAAAEVLAALDEGLAETLAQAAAATGDEEEELRRQIRATLERHTRFASSSGIVQSLDNNPFLPLSIGRTLTATLAALSALMRP